MLLAPQSHSAPSTCPQWTDRESLNLARSLFAYALDSEYLEKNPIISGLIPRKKSNNRKQRSPFSSKDLEQIFNPEISLRWCGDKPSRFYIPLLALFTGSRLEEMANLYCEDVFQNQGLWCIEHNINNGRKLKNKNAVRTIPLHPFIVDEIKFPQYVDSVKAGPHRTVFPELTKAHNKYSHHFGKAFSRYLRNKAGIKDRKKTFHSFQHNVTDHLYKTLVQGTLVEELTGRAGKTEGSVRYFQGYNAKILYEECILKLDYGIDLSHLKNSKFVIK